MTLLEKRDAILSSLRAQFRTKVLSVRFKSYRRNRRYSASVVIDEFLIDLANNAAQALAED